MTALAERRDELTELVSNANRTRGAIADENARARRGAGAPARRRCGKGNTTFVNLRATLDDLDVLVAESKPATKDLALFRELRPLSRDAARRSATCASSIRGPARQRPDRPAAQGAAPWRGRRAGAGATREASAKSQPVIDFIRPYGARPHRLVPRLRPGPATTTPTATTRAWRRSSTPSFDEPGGRRAAPQAPDDQRSTASDRRVERRCPGGATQPASDGSTPFTDDGTNDCDPTRCRPGHEARARHRRGDWRPRSSPSLGTGAERRRRRRLPGARDLRERLVRDRGRRREGRRREGRQGRVARGHRRQPRGGHRCDHRRPGFQDFQERRECAIRPQSLIGDKFVECTLTQPRPEGQPEPRRCARSRRATARASYLLPVEQTSQAGRPRPGHRHLPPALPPAAGDHPQRARRRPGRPARGPANRTIRSADPALKETDKVLKILAEPEQGPGRPGRRLGPRARAAGARPAQRGGLHRERRTPSRGDGRAARRPRAQSFELLPRFLRGAAPDDGPPRRPGRRVDAGAARLQARWRPTSTASPSAWSRSRGRIPAFARWAPPRSSARPALTRSGADRRRPRGLLDEAASRSRRTCAELAVILRDTGGIERLMIPLLLPVGLLQRLRPARPLPPRRPARQDLRLTTRPSPAAAATRTSPARRPRDAKARRASRRPGPRPRGRGPRGEGGSGAGGGDPRGRAARAGAQRPPPAQPAPPPGPRRAAAPRRPRPRPAGAGRGRRSTRTASSTTCWEADRAARRGLHRGEPRPHRRGDDARRHRRGLPRLQREQRPAVRADLRAQGRGAQRGDPREGQRGAHRRHARRRGRRDRGPAAPTAARRAC